MCCEKAAASDRLGTLSMNRRDLLRSVQTLALLSLTGFGHSAFARAGTGKRLPAPDYTPEDSFFGKAYIDVDEWRDTPVRFRYVHGGFEGTDTRFSFYLPEAQMYQGRMYQALAGGSGGNETAVLNALRQYDQIGVTPPRSLIGAFQLGGFLIESNQGHIGNDMSGTKGDVTIVAYRATTETARFARILAAAMYGAPPKFCYLYGGSGGAVRSINTLERVPDIWQGAVPIVAPSDMSGILFSPLANVVRLLGQEQKDRIDDAVDVGGSGDPFAGLNGEQADALRMLYRMGFPTDVGFSDPSEMVTVWVYNQPVINQLDPTYWSDFWTKPGYAGHDLPSAKADRITIRAKVRRILTAGELAAYKPAIAVVDERGKGYRPGAPSPETADQPAAVILDIDSGLLSKLGCSNFIVETGAAKGRERTITTVYGDALLLTGTDKENLEGIVPGDTILIDNGKFIAFCFYYRHHAFPEFKEYGLLVKDGVPIFPQRKVRFKSEVSMQPFTWDVGARKLIFVSSFQDRGVFRSAIAADIDQIRRSKGQAFLDNQVRVWINEHAQHGGVADAQPGRPVTRQRNGTALNTRLIDYQGSVTRALKALTDWVETGKAPLPNTNYRYDDEAQVTLPAHAADRLGVQPVIELRANGVSKRVAVKAGQPVRFVAIGEAPPDTGVITTAEWDFESAGTFDHKDDMLTGRDAKVTISAEHSYARPGTYFATVRMFSTPVGEPADSMFRLPNLGRIRVVVT